MNKAKKKSPTKKKPRASIAPAPVKAPVEGTTDQPDIDQPIMATHELSVPQKLGLGVGVLSITFSVVLGLLAVVAAPKTSPSNATPLSTTPARDTVIKLDATDPTLQQTNRLQTTQGLYGDSAPSAQTGTPLTSSTSPQLQ